MIIKTSKHKKNVPLFKVFMPKDVDREVSKTLHSGYIAEGEHVKKFTKTIADFLGNRYVVATSSCTMALTLAYEVAGIKSGDEVISTPLTCIATNIPLIKLGAKIIWADCEPRTGMIDPNQLRKLITKKTKAIVVLHKDGDLAKMDQIIAIAKAHKIKIIEDAAHVFGARYKGKMVGTLGDFACFSFQAIKHITTGDGGALVCKNKEDFKLARKFKWFGLDKEESHLHENIWMDDISLAGYKGNMNDIGATIGLVQMRYIHKLLKIYNRNGELYTSLLQGIPGIMLVDRDKANYPIYWAYTLLAENREKLMRALTSEKIGSGVIHPRNDTYSVFKKFRKMLPGVEYYSSRELSLPCGWWVTPADIQRIVGIIRNVQN